MHAGGQSRSGAGVCPVVLLSEGRSRGYRWGAGSLSRTALQRALSPTPGLLRAPLTPPGGGHLDTVTGERAQLVGVLTRPRVGVLTRPWVLGWGLSPPSLSRPPHMDTGLKPSESPRGLRSGCPSRAGRVTSAHLGFQGQVSGGGLEAAEIQGSAVSCGPWHPRSQPSLVGGEPLVPGTAGQRGLPPLPPCPSAPPSLGTTQLAGRRPGTPPVQAPAPHSQPLSLLRSLGWRSRSNCSCPAASSTTFLRHPVSPLPARLPPAPQGSSVPPGCPWARAGHTRGLRAARPYVPHGVPVGQFPGQSGRCPAGPRGSRGEPVTWLGGCGSKWGRASLQECGARLPQASGL